MPSSDHLSRIYFEAPDAVLLEALADDPEAYSPEAWTVIMQECSTRGLAAAPSHSPLPSGPGSGSKAAAHGFPEYLTVLALSAGYVGLALQMAILVSRLVSRPLASGTQDLGGTWLGTAALAVPSLVAIVVGTAFRDINPRAAKVLVIAGPLLLLTYLLLVL